MFPFRGTPTSNIHVEPGRGWAIYWHASHVALRDGGECGNVLWHGIEMEFPVDEVPLPVVPGLLLNKLYIIEGPVPSMGCHVPDCFNVFKHGRCRCVVALSVNGPERHHGLYSSAHIFEEIAEPNGRLMDWKSCATLAGPTSCAPMDMSIRLLQLIRN